MIFKNLILNARDALVSAQNGSRARVLSKQWFHSMVVRLMSTV